MSAAEEGAGEARPELEDSPYGHLFKKWKEANESLKSKINDSSATQEVQELTKVVNECKDELMAQFPERAKKDIKREDKRLDKAAKLAKFQNKEKMMASVATSQGDLQKKRADRTQKLKDSMEGAVTYDVQTAKGEKKDTSVDMPSAFSPKFVEACWYDWWEKQGFFKPENCRGEGDPFVIVIPPPNVTGQLHLGHALTNTIQDTLVRWHRMKGQPTLWVPGTDHAGIATQVVVEKQLKKQTGQTRHDLGREKFIEKVWTWKNEKGGAICRQLRRLGSSLDWDREVFTMDDKRSESVKEAFVRMFEKGIIYRDVRLVNWCCALRTAISDIEVERQEVSGRTLITPPNHTKAAEFGVLHSFAYPIEGGGEIVVATTRIETMLGDTAVAVHPDDPRYTQYHGKFVLHPFQNRKIPIILDAKLVDMSFGTGAVKVTPAHDPNDFEVGKRHNLEFINVFDDTGLINGNGAPFTGEKRFDCRTLIVEKLKEKGLFRGVSDNAMVIPICSRSGDIIEPMVKPQWFVKLDDVAARSVQAVKDGELRIVPDTHKHVWYEFLNNIRDWCVSRQLWWGHRIPAYYIRLQGETKTMDNGMERWVVARTREDALKQAAEKMKVDPSQIILEQDPDVLDTWFSSGLFPFAVFNWPNQTEDLAKYFPTTLLETGHDILFFWVARMVMMSYCLMDQLPFKDVFLHAMIRDAHGKKMSKSKGNVIDPVDVMEGISLEGLYGRLTDSFLPLDELERAKKVQKADFSNGIIECGTDALRFALLAYTQQGKDVNLDINRVIGYRQFCNKLWNAIRFAMMRMGSDFAPTADVLRNLGTNKHESLSDKWILSRIAYCATQCNNALNGYEFSNYCTAIYNFWLYELCDVYLETIKPTFIKAEEAVKAGAKFTPDMLTRSDLSENELALVSCETTKNVLWFCLDVALRLTHPSMPFITEELWQRLPGRASLAHTLGRHTEKDSVMLARYPLESNLGDYVEVEAARLACPDAEEGMAVVTDAINRIRSLRTTYHIANGAKPAAYLVPTTEAAKKAFGPEGRDYLAFIARLGEVSVLSGDVPKGCIATVTNGCTVYFMIVGHVDIEKEIVKIEEKISQITVALNQLIADQSKPDFSKRPEELRAQHADKLESQRNELAINEEALDKLRKMVN